VDDHPDTTARRGRRSGKTQTRATILRVALTQFAETGYADTSVRSVAAAAGVNPSLVTHFFANKEGLFVAAVGTLMDDIRPAMAAALVGDPDRLGHRIAAAYLALWDSPATSLRLRAVYRSASASPAASTIVQRQLATTTAEPFKTVRASDRTRLPIVMGQLLGIAVTRYLFETTQLPLDKLVEIAGHAAQATLDA